MINYIISPLDSNETILQQLTKIAKYLNENGIYKIYSFNGNYDNSVNVYSLSSITNLGEDTLSSGDVIVFNNCYYGQITSVGEFTFTITTATSFKGAKGDTGANGQDGTDGTDGTDGVDGLTGLECVKVLTDTLTPIDDNLFSLPIPNFNRTPVVNEKFILLQFINTTLTIRECTIVSIISDVARFSVQATATHNLKGDTGANGQDGTNGVGISSIVKTSTSGLVDTYTITFTNGTTTTFQITNGKDGVDGTNGTNGTNGTDGVGISSIVKTSTSGLVDTYTITFTNNTTFAYNITNGADGQNGISIVSVVKTSTSGLVDTYTITYSNNTTSTFTITNGADGQSGTQVVANPSSTTGTLTGISIDGVGYAIQSGDSEQSITFNSKSDLATWYASNYNKITRMVINSFTPSSSLPPPTIECSKRLFSNFGTKSDVDIQIFRSKTFCTPICIYDSSMGRVEFECICNVIGSQEGELLLDTQLRFTLDMYTYDGEIMMGCFVETQYYDYDGNQSGIIYQLEGQGEQFFKENGSMVYAPTFIPTNITIYYK